MPFFSLRKTTSYATDDSRRGLIDSEENATLQPHTSQHSGHLQPQDELDTIELKAFPDRQESQEGLHKDDDNKTKSLVLNPKNWMQGMQLCIYVTASILALNVVLTIVACAFAFAHSNQRFAVSASLFGGNCSKTRNIATGMHLGINILSTAMLAAGNYCMQGLVAPDREDIDHAHSQRQWLDVGLSSIRNLVIVSWRRKVLWATLLFTTLPIHLLYNSTVFSSMDVNEYPVLIASSELDWKTADLSTNYGACWQPNTNQSLSSFITQFEKGTYQNMTAEECVDELQYNQIVPGRGTVVLLVDYNNTQPTDSIFAGGVNYPNFIPEPSASNPGFEENYAYNWSVPIWNMTVPALGSTVEFNQFSLQHVYRFISDKILQQPNTNFTAEAEQLNKDVSTLYRYIIGNVYDASMIHQFLGNKSNWANSSWAAEVSFDENPPRKCMAEWPLNSIDRYGNFPLRGCLAMKGEEHCQLFFSPVICFVVIICNAIKVVCMFLATRQDRGEILLTTGDAISSFLKRPDPYTVGRCLMSKETLAKDTQPWGGHWYWFPWFSHQPLAPDWEPHVVPDILPGRKRWFYAANKGHWVALVALCLSIITAAIYLLANGIVHIRLGHDTDFHSLWNMGFGSLNQYSLFASTDKESFGIIVLANTPQLIVSIAYFLFNYILTSMLLVVEYTSFATERKALRVSWPTDSQRSTYFLTLPYRYSIPLMIVSAILHWLVSQSLFFGVITINPLVSYSDSSTIMTTAAWSPMATIFAIILGSLMLLGLLGLGLRRFKSRMPNAGSCSAAISAACHPPSDDRDAAVKAVMWGETAHPDDEKDNDNDDYGNYASGNRIIYAHCSFTSLDVESPVSGKVYT